MGRSHFIRQLIPPTTDTARAGYCDGVALDTGNAKVADGDAFVGPGGDGGEDVDVAEGDAEGVAVGAGVGVGGGGIIFSQ